MTESENIDLLALTGDVVPVISGQAMQTAEPANSPVAVATPYKLSELSGTFACALHMHQPTVPAGPHGELICNLQYMFDHPEGQDNHNASVFAECYGRMADIISQLDKEGCDSRIMLDYSGNLFWGLEQMKRDDILSKLRSITIKPEYQKNVEWLGTMWSHSVVPSTPLADVKLHITAWQEHFAALFGVESLSRVKGFSPPEMALPSDPDMLYNFVTCLKDCGYDWLLVQEHTVHTIDGSPLAGGQRYVPNRLLARNSHGQEASITAIIKTQGSDSKLIGQMQPYYEARSLAPVSLGSIDVPPLVTQIGDGENGGVMMNEFPSAYFVAWRKIAAEKSQAKGGSNVTAGVNVSEYLAMLKAVGVVETDYPVCMAAGQPRIWARVESLGGLISPETVREGILALKKEDPSFHVEGNSWTNDISWTKGYEGVIGQISDLSTKFHQKWDADIEKSMAGEGSDVTQTMLYRQCLLHLLLLETSCFRYWGAGQWTDYANEIYRRGLCWLAEKK